MKTDFFLDLDLLFCHPNTSDTTLTHEIIGTYLLFSVMIHCPFSDPVAQLGSQAKAGSSS
jgi:hypothetical protein